MFSRRSLLNSGVGASIGAFLSKFARAADAATPAKVEPAYDCLACENVRQHLRYVGTLRDYAAQHGTHTKEQEAAGAAVRKVLLKHDRKPATIMPRPDTPMRIPFGSTVELRVRPRDPFSRKFTFPLEGISGLVHDLAFGRYDPLKAVLQELYDEQLSPLYLQRFPQLGPAGHLKAMFGLYKHGVASPRVYLELAELDEVQLADTVVHLVYGPTRDLLDAVTKLWAQHPDTKLEGRSSPLQLQCTLDGPRLRLQAYAEYAFRLHG